MHWGINWLVSRRNKRNAGTGLLFNSSQRPHLGIHINCWVRCVWLLLRFLDFRFWVFIRLFLFLVVLLLRLTCLDKAHCFFWCNVSDIRDVVELSTAWLDYMGISNFLLTAWQFITRDVISLGVSAARSNSFVAHKNILIILSTPSFVVDVQKRLFTRSFDFEFNDCGAPNVFSV